MRSARDWVAGKLAEDSHPPVTTEPVGRFGLLVRYGRSSEFVVFCAATDPGELFEGDDLDAALQELPDAEFVVAVPSSRIAPSAYERAAEIDGVAFGQFGDLQSAIGSGGPPGEFLDREAVYEQSRLLSHGAVTGVRRVGRNAWEVHRRPGLRPLSIATSTTYEFTAEEMRSLVRLYRGSGVELDAVVVTNSACSGFSRASLAAARDADVGLVTLDNFLADLGRR